MAAQFHHCGVICDTPQPGEVYIEATKVWITDPERSPYRIETLRFEPDSPVGPPIRNRPHFAYRVESIEEALRGQKVILPPFRPAEGVARPFPFMKGLRVAFIERDGAVIEFMQWD
jgi:hypothetical protein